MKDELIADIPISPESIREKIYIFRGKKVMLDGDLALLYKISTKILNKSVKRNLKRFPEDFMFQLTPLEAKSLRFQFGTLKSKPQGRHIKYAPHVFTEQGIAMLSGVLNTDRAISVNIQIIRIFTKLREMIDAYKELREKVEEMEKNNETNFQEIFRAIRLFIKEDEAPKGKLGFDTDRV